ncbi:MAG: pentapeptide repeat-containing protein [Deltaproteobacteria bacterium]|nr:pentapeptide repeat-containing protein [Deltaproteobacteria bacterium]
MPGPSDEALQTRWKTEDGEARRARLIAHLPGDWRAHATPWSDDADVRPDLRGIDLQKARLAGVDLSDTRLDAAIFDGADLSGGKLCRALGRAAARRGGLSLGSRLQGSHAGAMIAPAYSWLDKLQGRPPPNLPPAKVLVSLQSLIDRDAPLPPKLAALQEAEANRKIILGWLSRVEGQLLPDVKRRLGR